jgi:hypothetical protein
MIQQIEKPLFRKAAILALFLAPIVYISQIFAVAVHEIIGHGLAAVSLGGRFDGFVLRLDGMGWAFSTLPLDATTTDTIILLTGGVTATTVTGFVFLALASVFRKRLAIRLSLLVLSFSLLMEGISYVFWNSYHPVPPGDIGRIITLWHDVQFPGEIKIHTFIFVISGFVFFTVSFFLYALLFQGIEEALFAGGRFSPKERFWTLLLFLAVPGSAVWFMFDWNQLAPGIGVVPCVVGAVSTLISATILYRFSLRPCSYVPGMNITWYHLLLSYGCLFIIVVLTLFWFQNGVRWT